MNTKELMIGDWVRLAVPDKYNGALCTIKSLYGHNKEDGAYISVFVQDTKFGFTLHEAFNEDLRSIPLTDDILKANGFDVVKNGDTYTIWNRDEDDTGIVLYDITMYHREQDAHFCTIIISPEASVYKNIRYVHELQHALRLCGSVELADNFKIE